MIANIKNIERTRWGSYVIYEPPQDFDLTYFPKTKSIKELDIITTVHLKLIIVL